MVTCCYTNAYRPNVDRNVRQRGCFACYQYGPGVITLLGLSGLLAIFPILYGVYEYRNHEFYDSLQKGTCNITNFTGPVTMPSVNDTYGWRDCECKQCDKKGNCKTLHNSVSSCINMYTNESSNRVRNIYNKHSTLFHIYHPGDDDPCTFFTDCGCGNIMISQQLNSSLTYRNEYLNNDVVCYHDKNHDYIYLHKNKYGYGLTGIIFSCIFTISALYVLCLTFSMMINIVSYTCGCKKYLDSIDKREHEGDKAGNVELGNIGNTTSHFYEDDSIVYTNDVYTDGYMDVYSPSDDESFEV
jgi:hypothetical protein